MCKPHIMSSWDESEDCGGHVCVGSLSQLKENNHTNDDVENKM